MPFYEITREPLQSFDGVIEKHSVALAEVRWLWCVALVLAVFGASTVAVGKPFAIAALLREVLFSFGEDVEAIEVESLKPVGVEGCGVSVRSRDIGIGGDG